MEVEWPNKEIGIDEMVQRIPKNPKKRSSKILKGNSNDSNPNESPKIIKEILENPENISNDPKRAKFYQCNFQWSRNIPRIPTNSKRNPNKILKEILQGNLIDPKQQYLQWWRNAQRILQDLYKMQKFSRSSKNLEISIQSWKNQTSLKTWSKIQQELQKKNPKKSPKPNLFQLKVASGIPKDPSRISKNLDRLLAIHQLAIHHRRIFLKCQRILQKKPKILCKWNKSHRIPKDPSMNSKNWVDWRAVIEQLAIHQQRIFLRCQKILQEPPPLKILCQ